MTDAIETPKKQATPLKSATDDLSEDIKQSVEKQRHEEVRCVRLFGDRYRCNWWVKDATTQPVFTRTGKISKSRFLRVTKVDGRLVIEGLNDRN